MSHGHKTNGHRVQGRQRKESSGKTPLVVYSYKTFFRFTSRRINFKGFTFHNYVVKLAVNIKLQGYEIHAHNKFLLR